MYASSQAEGNLGVRPLLEKTLEDFVPFILTPPGDGSVHGGIVKSPLEMVAHDFAHAMIINSYLQNNLFGRDFREPKSMFVRWYNRVSDLFFKNDRVRQDALSQLRELDLATEEGRKKLMKLFVIFHEFSTNDAFKTVQSYADPQSYVPPKTVQGFIKRNLERMGQIFEGNDDALEQAMIKDVERRVLRELPREWQDVDLAGNFRDRIWTFLLARW